MISLSNITSSTRVTFPRGETSGTSRVLFVREYQPGNAIVITEETPFHPVSHSWPDQQGDIGTIETDGVVLPVVNTLTAATNPQVEDRHLYIDTEIPVRKFESGWLFFVAHVVALPDGYLFESLEGKEVSLNVDSKRRKGLSATHTSTHLVALALNKFTRDLWRKEVEQDALGHPDLDKLAMQRSTIMPVEAIDEYRFGKSLRKKGFGSESFFTQAEQLTNQINQQVNDWIRTGQSVTIKAAGPTLEAVRLWTCHLDGKDVEFPCGGTHLQSLGELDAVQVWFELFPEAHEIKMHTVPKLRE